MRAGRGREKSGFCLGNRNNFLVPPEASLPTRHKPQSWREEPGARNTALSSLLGPRRAVHAGTGAELLGSAGTFDWSIPVYTFIGKLDHVLLSVDYTRI